MRKIILSFEKDSEGEDIKTIVQALRNSTAGVRMEVSFQNLASSNLQKAFDELNMLSKAILASHLNIHRLHREGYIPVETMRFSPLQIVTTSSITSLLNFQAKCLHKMFRTIFEAVIKGKNKL